MNVVAGEPLTLEAVVEVDGRSVVAMSIFHRVAGASAFSEVTMSAAGGGLWFGTISAGNVLEAGLEYYLAATLDDESLLAYPLEEPQLNPVFIQVLAGGEQMSFDPLALFGLEEEEESPILILSPTPRKIYLGDEVVIAVSLFNVEDVDEESIRLLLDGRDVTAQAEISADLVTYLPSKLAQGSHQVELRVSNLSGVAQEPAAWRFLVAASASLTTERTYSHSGKVVSAFRRDDIDKRVLEVGDLKLSYRGGWDWLKLRSNVRLTTQEDPFKPARNRYSASLSTSIFKLGLGDVTPRINRFILDGKRIRGYDADLRLKYFNLRIVKGELERVIQGRPESAYKVNDYFITSPDTAELRITRSGYSFRRNLLAVRPSFGSGQNFELAFIYLKAKDDVPSVLSELGDGEITIDDSTFGVDYFSDFEPTSGNTRVVTFEDIKSAARDNAGLFTYNLPDSNWTGRSPKDNLVVGSDLTLAFNKRRFVIQSGFAMSMLNNNIWDPVLTKEGLDTMFPGDDTVDGFIGGVDGISLDDIPVDPGDYEEYFHINANQVPLVPIDVFGLDTNRVGAILNMPSMAYHASMKLNYLRNFITLEYRQVGPEFNSLANPNIQKNVKVRSISDRLRLFRNKLMLSGKYRTTNDDIVKQPGEAITSTVTTNLSANINLGRGLPSFSIGTRSYTRENGVTTLDTVAVVSGTDTVNYIDRRESTTTKSLNLGFTYQLELLGSRHDLSLNISRNDIADDYTDRITGDPLYTTPRSPRAISRATAIGVNSRISDRLRTSLSLSTTASEFGAGEDILEDSVVVSPGMIAQNLFNLDLMLIYRLPALKLNARGGFSFLTSNSDRSNSASKPPNFTRLGIKGGLEYEITKELLLMTTFDFRTKTVDLPDGGSESVPSSIISANLRYKF
ncbi:MAG: hypothetical protein IID13_01435 [Candidatus Marinimicrobia bacterium]|nr:hypothetical protein [Candidatus Neomarinimicrobiota bacterium]